MVILRVDDIFNILFQKHRRFYIEESINMTFNVDFILYMVCITPSFSLQLQLYKTYQRKDRRYQCMFWAQEILHILIPILYMLWTLKETWWKFMYRRIHLSTVYVLILPSPSLLSRYPTNLEITTKPLSW